VGSIPTAGFDYKFVPTYPNGLFLSEIPAY